jgi:hypothetical protein
MRREAARGSSDARDAASYSLYALPIANLISMLENEDELEWPSESADLTMHCALLMAEERSGAGCLPPERTGHGG